LIAADGVIGGLLLAGDSLPREAPQIIGVVAAGAIIGSLALGLIAFATRRYGP